MYLKKCSDEKLPKVLQNEEMLCKIKTKKRKLGENK